MKVVVIGGTGLIGSKLIKKLIDKGEEAIAASPSKGVNTLTGEGLDKILQGAQVVVDVSNSPSFEDQAVLSFFETSTRNLLKAEQKAGIKHHIALSVVGSDLLNESGYFRAKVAQEKLIASSPIPYTIVRATQFFEFLSSIVETSKVGSVIHVPDALIQPIASDDVAEALLQNVLKGPKNQIVDIAGPDPFLFLDIVQAYLKATHDPRIVIAAVDNPYFGAQLQQKTLVPQNKAWLGSMNFGTWLQKQLQKEQITL